ncbi:ORC complex protein Cdc6/Orc1 [Haloarcula quadrata]|jgi:cell division control protein 6|uniref:ORC1-type DNA replication protein 3 n=4 Tax=Haloarcula TaxID=2237 RepID=CDC6C_HALMA|nr:MULTISPECIES: ORC1-type DNA replication protein [Haloarcula]Q5UYP1.1 RecName: Full=ORC1-type DNA replication protein 3 [Haloarcula marismortui ATCC 43049]AAV47612.1 cell division control protein 6 [Haloarcula marismortui ATCC 43049]EMA25543.1 cell division control protein 6 [Haloarcula californiae ATCC 33799]NHX39673.1 ORC1-type DNA replication protein [Haloarcula sp. R1-2]QCP92306.1 ORC1-type DNA replication protein [Haloarcula marismortui ATCC 43049]RKS81024.1 ORC complex protein Cdc6/Or
MSDDPEDRMLGWDESVFRDEHVFEIDWLPETFKHRDTQMETLKYALRPAVRGSRPLNVIARGPPGTGKTTAVQILFDELTAQTDVKTVRVNCQMDSTRYAVFSRLFAEIFDYEPPSSGISFKKLFSQITDKLVEEDEVLVVALDDVNYLFYESEASDTLYSLLRAHEAHSGAKIGVICVSSDLELDTIDALDTRVQSVFRPEEVYFNPYGQAEIADILGERADRGFNEGVVGPTVLDRVAELTEEQGGDLRVGIDLLRRAGMNAEMRASRSVETEDVEAAYDKSKYVHLSRRLRELSDSETALVEVIAAHDGQQAGDIYDAFSEQTDLGYTRYSEIINKLDQLDIIDADYTNVEGRGRSRELTLNYDADAVLERL